MPKQKTQSPGGAELSCLNLFGPPPLIEGEDESAYNDLLAKISGAVKSQDIFEEIWVREIVDLSWEVLRWRRLKATLLTASMNEGLKTVLNRLNSSGIAGLIELDDLTARWMQGEFGARKKVDTCLHSAGLTMEAVRAQTLAAKLPEVDRIDRMIMAAEARRNATLREIGHHRQEFGQMLRKAARQIEDADYEDVTPSRVAE